MQSLQEMFNITLHALRAQGVASFRTVSIDSDADTCVYRGPRGTKCAVGHLLPDELYSGELDDRVSDAGTSVQSICNWKPELADFFGVGRCDKDRPTASHQWTRMNFLMDLQQAHDQHMPHTPSDSLLESWERRMEKIAKEYELVYTPPTD